MISAPKCVTSLQRIFAFGLFLQKPWERGNKRHGNAGNADAASVRCYQKLWEQIGNGLGTKWEQEKDKKSLLI